MERKLVLESCLANGSWGFLDMYVLLTNDIVEFDVSIEAIDLERRRKLTWSPAIDIKLNHKQHEDLFLSFLRDRCPVSIRNNFLLLSTL